MIPVSEEYKRQLIAGNRRYVIKIPVFLSGNQTSTPDFTLTNNEIWEGGVTIDNAISSDNSFDIGAAIVGSLSININNISGSFSQYDFYDAKLVLYLGVEGDIDEYETQRYYRIGYYVVDTPSYNGSIITLDCLDNMIWFDVPFSGVSISFPTTAGALVGAICNYVGVTLGTAGFPNYSTVITDAPEQDYNCREIIQFVAQMCCCYCKINTAGQLALAWYDKNAIISHTGYDGGSFGTNTTPYSDGDTLNGGAFSPWNTGDVADGGSFTDINNSAFLGNNFEMEVSTDDVVVTGVRIKNTMTQDGTFDELYFDPVVELEHERYILVIENNPFINRLNVSTLATIIGTTLAGLPIRGFNSSSLSDFSYETGDMVTILDFRGNLYYTWITSLSFQTSNAERFSCGVQSVRQRSETRYSGSIRTLAEANVSANKILSDYDNAVRAMNDLAQDALGYNQYEYPVTGGGVITWLYSGSIKDTTDPEHPKFPNSDTVFMISGDGVFISYDGGTTYTQGYDANSGTAILNLIFAHGITADWIKTGIINASDGLSFWNLNTANFLNGFHQESSGRVYPSGGGYIDVDIVTDRDMKMEEAKLSSSETHVETRQDNHELYRRDTQGLYVEPNRIRLIDNDYYPSLYSTNAEIHIKPNSIYHKGVDRYGGEDEFTIETDGNDIYIRTYPASGVVSAQAKVRIYTRGQVDINAPRVNISDDCYISGDLYVAGQIHGVVVPY